MKSKPPPVRDRALLLPNERRPLSRDAAAFAATGLHLVAELEGYYASWPARDNCGVANSAAGDFGRCACTGEIRVSWGPELSIPGAGDEVVIVRDFPRGVCEKCGARYYKAAALAVLERTWGIRAAQRRLAEEQP